MPTKPTIPTTGPERGRTPRPGLRGRPSSRRMPMPPPPRARRRLRRATPLGAVLIVLLAGVAALVLVRPGGSAGPGVAQAGSTPTPTGQPPGQGGTGQPSMAAFSACIRAHGVPNFPDPDSQGRLIIRQGSGFDPNSRQFQSAQQACHSRIPQQAPGAGSVNQAQVLKFAACMRSHGVPNFPDPRFSGGNFQLSLPPGIDPNSPQWRACLSLSPFAGWASGPGGAP
jgi:hypothetical protein